jgi:hypothetical protein
MKSSRQKVFKKLIRVNHPKRDIETFEKTFDPIVYCFGPARQIGHIGSRAADGT